MTEKVLHVELQSDDTIKFYDETGAVPKEKHMKKADTIRWVTHDGTLDLDFTKHPFTVRPIHLQPHEIHNFHVHPDAKKDSYDYLLTLTTPNQNEYLVDPKIILDDGKQSFALFRIVSTVLAVALAASLLFGLQFDRDQDNSQLRKRR